MDMSISTRAAKRAVVGFGVTLALAGTLVSGKAGFAQTAPKPDEIIAARQAGYDLLGSVAVDMKHAVDAGADVTGFADNAAAMANWGRAIPGLFPPGTESGHNTKALPAIWSDRAGFEKAAANFTDAAEKLSEAAKSGDKSAFADALKATGGTCGACHKAYRARNG